VHPVGEERRVLPVVAQIGEWKHGDGFFMSGHCRWIAGALNVVELESLRVQVHRQLLQVSP
jgi:hypothetical protein